MSSSTSGPALREAYATESAKIQKQFEETGNGRAAIEERAALTDRIASELFLDFFGKGSPDVQKLALIAVAGYGRRALFPHSDVDLVFLCEDAAAEAKYKDAAREMCQELWDIRLRMSPTTRVLSECEQFDAGNPEFSIPLLDCRMVAGDAKLFDELIGRVLPQLLARYAGDLCRNLAELTRQRHARSGDTIFHLEPNLKNSPGALRDFHVACWLTRLAKDRDAGAAPPAHWQQEYDRAFDFLAAARCLVHYRQGRDDNALTYEAQAEAASRGIGVGRPVSPADWMRSYFRVARLVYDHTLQLLSQAVPEKPSFAERLGEGKSRQANSAFFVSIGKLSIRDSKSVEQLDRMLEVFELVARDGLKLTHEAERSITGAVPKLTGLENGLSASWPRLRRILTAPHAADSLRAMHALGVLVRLFPEWAAIDSLVIRDFYHHYTVDEHSFRTIQSIGELRGAKTEWEKKFAGILGELEQPALLFLALLFHDVGKGLSFDDPVEGSLHAIEEVFPRLGLTSEESETVRYLIANHLEMSANLLRRDIFDPQTVRNFAEKVGTPERLKLLCLFTYADIRAINPEALTPWKAESLWQLYVSTENYLNRSLDEERVRGGKDDRRWVERILPLMSEAGDQQALREFLDGLPRRYLLAHSPQEVALHFRMSCQLDASPVQLHLERVGHIYELTVLTPDRPSLFAGLSGTLAAWGMNIWKAEAFANASYTVVDTFHFTDPFQTLESNPSEEAHFKSSIVDVLCNVVSLESLLRARKNPRSQKAPKATISTQIRFDDFCSSHSTLMEITTQDHPGLLYQITSVLAQYGCNLEVALIDTEGERAIDVFYLTLDGAKLGANHQRKLRDLLLAQL